MRLQTLCRAISTTKLGAARSSIMPSSVNNETVVPLKTEARKEMKAKLKQLTQQSMQCQSTAICKRVLDQGFFASARDIGVYITCAKLREVDTTSLLTAAVDAGKRCFVPLVEDRDSNMRLFHIDRLEELQAAPPFGILEPAPTYSDGSPRLDVMHLEGALQLLLMPGLAFDRQGGRLGRGGGYYDKLLSGMGERCRQQGWQPPLLVALALSEQMLDEVPMGEWDERVDVVVTPEDTFLCSKRAKAFHTGSC